MDTNKYKNILEVELGDLEAELKTLGVHNPQVAEDWIATPSGIEEQEADSNVSADRAEEWEEKEAILALLETRYNNVRRALEKIATGTFGICEISGEPIEEARLNANPAARTCMAHLNDEIDLIN
jgi:RNA polymerase-binding transcription factor DksA